MAERCEEAEAKAKRAQNAVKPFGARADNRLQFLDLIQNAYDGLDEQSRQDDRLVNGQARMKRIGETLADWDMWERARAEAEQDNSGIRQADHPLHIPNVTGSRPAWISCGM